MTPRDHEDENDESWGFYYDTETVRLAWIGLKIFHALPYAGGWFDQPYHLILDILTYNHLQIVTEDNSIPYFPNDVYEDQFTEGIKRGSL